MESFVEHIFVLLGASALVIAVFFLVFHFSPVRTLPSMVTLRVKAILGILAATFLTVVSVVLSVRYNHELQQLFPNLFEYGVFPAVSLSAVILLSFLICFVFKYEKAVWLHRNPKRSRLMLQAVNHTFKVKGGVNRQH